MSHTIYALLVGINDYDGGVTSLNGCVNDVKSMAEFLRLRTQGGEFELAPLILTSGDRDNAAEVKPTRQAVIDGFRNHLCQAGPEVREHDWIDAARPVGSRYETRCRCYQQQPFDPSG